MAGAQTYTIEIIQAPKTAKRIITIMLGGYTPHHKVEGFKISVNLEEQQAREVYTNLRKLYPPDQVSFAPLPPGSPAAQTSHTDPETKAVQPSVRPLAASQPVPGMPFAPNPVPLPPPPPDPEELMGSAVAWPHEVTRPDDLNKLEQYAREIVKPRAGKRIIRLGVHGERNYLIEPIRADGDPDCGKWRASVNMPDGQRHRLGSAPEWMGAIAIIYVYEQNLKRAPAMVNAVPGARGSGTSSTPEALQPDPAVPQALQQAALPGPTAAAAAPRTFRDLVAGLTRPGG